MPVCRMKRSERPDEPRERDTAIHHWVFLDIHGVIERDELMSDHLRINPKRHYRQTEQDETVRSLKCCTVAERQGASPVRCGGAISFSLSRRSFRHAPAELSDQDLFTSRARDRCVPVLSVSPAPPANDRGSVPRCCRSQRDEWDERPHPL